MFFENENMDELDKMLAMLEAERVQNKVREDFKNYSEEHTPVILPVSA